MSPNYKGADCGLGEIIYEWEDDERTPCRLVSYDGDLTVLQFGNDCAWYEIDWVEENSTIGALIMHLLQQAGD